MWENELLCVRIDALACSPPSCRRYLHTHTPNRPLEWLEYVRKYPSAVSFMTLSVLRNLTKEFPSFAFNNNLEATLETQIEDTQRARDRAREHSEANRRAR